MPKLEIKKTSELSRKEAAERLIELGRALADGSEVELGSSGDSVTMVVADRVRWELEIEVDGDEIEIEIEISWRDAPSGASAAEEHPPTESTSPSPARPARRGRPRKTPAK
ncbi:amphi-Trp domain-containing protein [Rhodococcus sp. (in: high G+C Gram-positive bacteria)]|uniref:amphi-Trp domain-containing protein n=1 Tax=Rhodococcus sp. TaxID=1831 RepID=UPI00388DD070